MSNDRVNITNDEGTLGSRITYHDDDVPISGDPKTGKVAAFSLRLVAAVSPPVVDGQVLQATSVSMRGNFAIVSYGMRGPDYVGAVDVFNITNAKRPVLKSSAVFEDADVNSVAYFDSDVYMAQATGDPTFEYPSVMEVLGLQGFNLILEDNQRVGLSSYAGTGIASTGSAVYATSGNTGGLEVVNPTTWQADQMLELHDARWVDVEGGKIVVAQGTPGQISVFDEATLNPLGTYAFTGADVAESKTTVEVIGGKAFIAAGPGGVQVLSVNTGAVLGSVPRPDPASLGLDPSVVVTNAVSADDDLLFISNGEAGVYVAEGETNFDATGSEAPQNLTLLGQLQFDALQSVNHVAYKNRYLIVAAGLGGLKIVEVR
ncbi:MAG: hypothetical protein HKN37_12365 [Rhodothermales bacterium]|nr:hypothetical protein [Rhodothermales bacterium]